MHSDLRTLEKKATIIAIVTTERASCSLARFLCYGAYPSLQNLGQEPRALNSCRYLEIIGKALRIREPSYYSSSSSIQSTDSASRKYAWQPITNFNRDNEGP
jgi:hypothetical protein